MQTLTTRGHAALRRGRASLAGQVYLLTFATFDRTPLFRDFWTAHAAVTGLLHAPARGDARVWSWVLMPDHAHLLVQLGSEGQQSLNSLVRNMKSVATRNVRRCMTLSHPLWQRAFHDRALRRDEDLRATARYIIANPLRAGLVRHIADYPFWGAAWLDDDRADLL